MENRAPILAAWFGAILAIQGCGDAPGPGVTATVHISQALAADTGSLSFYVVAPRLDDGVVLTCGALTFADVPIGDPRIVILGQADLAFTDPAARELRIEDVKAGKDRLVYGEGFDRTGVRNSAGCVGEVEIPTGGVAEVELILYPVN